jgi:hypothetical protein
MLIVATLNSFLEGLGDRKTVLLPLSFKIVKNHLPG